MKPKDFGKTFNSGYISGIKACYRIFNEVSDIKVAKDIIIRELEAMQLQQKQNRENVDNWIYCNE